MSVITGVVPTFETARPGYEAPIPAHSETPRAKATALEGKTGARAYSHRIIGPSAVIERLLTEGRVSFELSPVQPRGPHRVVDADLSPELVTVLRRLRFSVDELQPRTESSTKMNAHEADRLDEGWRLFRAIGPASLTERLMRSLAPTVTESPVQPRGRNAAYDVQLTDSLVAALRRFGFSFEPLMAGVAYGLTSAS